MSWHRPFLSPSDWVCDAVVAPIWLFVTCYLVLVNWNWARRLFPQDLYVELLLHTIVLSWATIVLVATTLGSLGRLNGSGLLLGVFLVSLAIYLQLCRYPVEPLPALQSLDLTELGWLVLWVGLIAFWIGHVIALGLWRFPFDWDSLAYHIPLVDQWVQSRSLYATGNSRWYNPGNNELLALWAVIPFSGDFLVSLNNVPAALLFACAAVTFASRIGLPRSLAHLSGFVLVNNFVVLRQLIDNENDVAVAALFFAALAYALCHAETSRGQPLALCVACLGLLAGVKYYALGYAGLGLLVWMLLIVLPRGLRHALPLLFLTILGILLFAGFWYLRNFLMTGTPLYPKDLFHQPDVLSHIYPDVARTSFVGNQNSGLLWRYAVAIWHRMGPCQTIGFFLTPLSLLWLLGTSAWSIIRIDSCPPVRFHLSMAVLLVGTGILLSITPFAVEDRPGTLNQLRWQYCPVRYGLCFLSTATIAAMMLLRDLLCWEQSRQVPSLQGWRHLSLTSLQFLVGLVIAGAAFYQLLWAKPLLPPMHWVQILNPFAWFTYEKFTDWAMLSLMCLNLLLLSLTVLLVYGIRGPVRTWISVFHGIRSQPKLWFVIVAVLLFSAWTWCCVILSDRWHSKFVAHYTRSDGFHALQHIDQATVSPQAILVLQGRCYAFFGSSRQHRVHQPVFVPSPSWYSKVLSTQAITLVVVEYKENSLLGHRRFLGFDQFLVENPSAVQQLGSWEERHYVYQVRSAE